jgi:hypothetical protein
VHYYSLSRGLTLVSFPPMILCNFIDSLDDGGVFEEYGPVGGHSPVIFEELDPMWLSRMWHAGGDSRRDMIDIVYMLYVVKTRL